MAASRHALDEYNSKRDFSKTPEPKGLRGDRKGRRRLYLIQKHAARRLHYDFRLEWEGVLLSWAVTRGPSLDPEDKRLAVRTEDHPLAYGRFEGTIPAGEYGGGTVMLWDNGSWEPLGDVEDGLKKGKLKFHLDGERLSGGWTLVRMRPRAGEKRENWLLIKERDAESGSDGSALVEEEVTSVATGRTMDEIAAGKGEKKARVWDSRKSAGDNVKAGAVAPLPRSRAGPRSRKGKAPPFVEPQLATLVEDAPRGEDWLSEAKFDGYRLLVSLGREGARCYTRSGLDWTDRFPDIAGALAGLDCDTALIDGEAVAFAEGSSFSALQAALKSGAPISFYAFDLLYLDGKDLRREPLVGRKEKLRALIGPTSGDILRYSEHIRGHSGDVFASLCKAGQEGIIAKRAKDPYRSGRAGSWVKVKCTRRQEFVIGGYSPSDKKGRPFASIILGTYDGDRLDYRGRVGTGFGGDTMSDLARLFAARRRKSPPFSEVPSDLPRKAVWLRPDLVAEIDFTELTRDGHVRHGVFQGLRRDKEARSVILENPKAADAAKDGQAGRKQTGPRAAKAGKSAGPDKAPRKARGEDVVAGVRISHPERVVFKGSGITKGDIAHYYAAAAGRFLDLAGGRPASLLRCPQGDIGDCFFQKHAGAGFPDAIAQVPIVETSGKTEPYILLKTAEGLVSAVQMGTIEFHIWGSTADKLEKPDRIVFDLDPDPSVGFDTVVLAAFELRGVLEAIGLKSLAMVTGGKGVHVVVPLRRRAEWPEVKAFAKALAGRLEEAAPERYTATMSKAKRKGRIFIDWLRNERGSTAIAPYSLRARKGAPVALPVDWDELEGLDRANGFSITEALDRLRGPDPWAEAGKWRQSLTRRILSAVETK